MNLSNLYNVTGAVFVVEDGQSNQTLLEIPDCEVVSLVVERPYVDTTSFDNAYRTFLPTLPAGITVSLEMLVRDGYQFHAGRALPMPRRGPAGIWLPNTTVEVVGVPLHEL